MKSIILILLFLTNVTFAGGLTLEEQHEKNQVRGMTSENATNYPIILHHGLFGFRKLLFIEYFYKIPKILRKAGFDVYSTEVYAFGDLKQRSLELGDQIDRILKMTGKDKVNIIAHSMGGLDSRMLISRLGYEDKIASLSMVGTPNRGSYLADVVTRFFDPATDNKKNEKEAEQIEALTKVMGELFVSTEPNKALLENTLRAVGDLSQRYLRDDFNPQTPDSPKVYYQSWAGKTARLMKVGRKDIVDAILLIPFKILTKHSGENDGMVSIESAKWGNFRGIIEADHLDMIGFFMGKTSKYFDHKEFYTHMAKELAEMGF
ncbi:MAG: hypothetical protein DRQ88_03760 [Epsilonproteobacteria bacterium]|nr:MAG: hypothetical protein DRQ89_04065 [Campylobacterota bacterium]RLA67155.1 MAG: hypothetical protein DRQ88_03760 [Campylobacterota bacterium]